jgi:hypothetical protein
MDALDRRLDAVCAVARPGDAELAASICASLVSKAFAVVPGAHVRAALERRVPASSTAWHALVDLWDDLPQDTHMADGGKYRFRRFSSLRASLGADGPRFEALPHRAFFQSEGYNELNGGVARSFESMPPEAVANPVLQALLAVCFESVRRAAGATDWEVELHPIRTRALGAQEGLATPEGIHRDGVDWFFVVLLRRANIRGGVSFVFDEQRRERLRHTLEEPFEMLAVHDPRTFHSVSPFVAAMPDSDAFRDVIVINFRDLSRSDPRL